MKKFLTLLILSFVAFRVNADKLLEDLDFSNGRWEMIGVSLHNFQQHPSQDEIGTFILTDQYIIKQIQEKWNFEPVYEDYCDYHYSLKFYHNGNLEKTLRINLVCNYVTVNGLSYKFTLNDFTEFRRYYKSIKWSRIRFKDMDLLQEAVAEIDKVPDVYWYGDVQQYNFDGFFTIDVDSIPWDANRDSVLEEMTYELQDKMDRKDFYLNARYWDFDEEVNWMHMSIEVYCPESFYKAYKQPNVTTFWKSHFSEQSYIQIVVIGMNKEEYFKLMGNN